MGKGRTGVEGILGWKEIERSFRKDTLKSASLSAHGCSGIAIPGFSLLWMWDTKRDKATVWVRTFRCSNTTLGTGNTKGQVLSVESKTASSPFHWSRGQTHPRPRCGYLQLVKKSKFAAVSLLNFFSRCPAASMVCTIPPLHVHQRSPSFHLAGPTF